MHAKFQLNWSSQWNYSGLTWWLIGCWRILENNAKLQLGFWSLAITTWPGKFSSYYSIKFKATKTPNYQMTLKFFSSNVCYFCSKNQNTKLPGDLWILISFTQHSAKQPKHLITRWPLSFSLKMLIVLLTKPKHWITKWLDKSIHIFL